VRVKVGLVSQETAWIGDKKPYLSIGQTFSIEKPAIGKIQVLVYYSEHADSIGYHTKEGTTLYCCTQSLFEQGICEYPGEVIVNDDKHVQVLVADFNDEKSEAVIFRNYTSISSNGMYYVKYFNCPGQNLGTVTIDGPVSWENPFGYLSAELYPFLWFFAIMTVAYVFLGLLWSILVAFHWKQILQLQNCISLVIFLGMVECVTWYHDFSAYNSSGNFVWGAIVVGVLTSTLKRTLSRLLVLVVSMGYGVVKANLGTDASKVYGLGILYFIVSLIQQLILTYLREGENEFLSFLSAIIIFPAALLDTIFYWWIFLSLMRTIQQLKLRKQEAKLAMYTKFFGVLVVSGIITVLVIAAQTALVATSTEDMMWRTWWMFQAFWHLLYFSILCAIALLWRPTTNNTRYAYVEAEDIEMTQQSTKRKTKEDSINTGIELKLDFLNDESDQGEEASKML